MFNITNKPTTPVFNQNNPKVVCKKIKGYIKGIERCKAQLTRQVRKQTLMMNKYQKQNSRVIFHTIVCNPRNKCYLQENIRAMCKLLRCQTTSGNTTRILCYVWMECLYRRYLFYILYIDLYSSKPPLLYLERAE